MHYTCLLELLPLVYSVCIDLSMEVYFGVSFFRHKGIV